MQIRSANDKRIEMNISVEWGIKQLMADIYALCLFLAHSERVAASAAALKSLNSRSTCRSSHDDGRAKSLINAPMLVNLWS